MVSNNYQEKQKMDFNQTLKLIPSWWLWTWIYSTWKLLCEHVNDSHSSIECSNDVWPNQWNFFRSSFLLEGKIYIFNKKRWLLNLKCEFLFLFRTMLNTTMLQMTFGLWPHRRLVTSCWSQQISTWRSMAAALEPTIICVHFRVGIS